MDPIVLACLAVEAAVLGFAVWQLVSVRRLMRQDRARQELERDQQA